MSNNIEQYQGIAKTFWPDAEMHSNRVSQPAELLLHEGFHTVRGSTSAAWNNKMFSIMEQYLFQESPPFRAFEMRDVQVFGCGFLLATKEGFVRQTRYLAPNVDNRIAHSLRDRIVKLDTSFPWIVASNASQSNYWHWTAQVLPGIMHAREFLLNNGCTEFGLLTHQLKKWQRESLELLDLAAKDIVEINIFQSAEVATVIYSDLLSSANPYTPSVYRAMVRERLIAKVDPEMSGRKLCISRQDTKRRPILNELEMHRSLAGNGFEIVTAGDLTVQEQVQALHSAEVVVAPHGAGSANFLYGRPGSKVLELSQAGHTNAGPASLCKTSGAAFWFDVFMDDGKGAATEGWTVDIDDVLETVGRMTSV